MKPEEDAEDADIAVAQLRETDRLVAAASFAAARRKSVRRVDLKLSAKLTDASGKAIFAGMGPDKIETLKECGDSLAIRSMTVEVMGTYVLHALVTFKGKKS